MPMLLLAAEEGAGFGLNPNILETNLVNILLVLGLVVYLATGYFRKVLSERRQELQNNIQDVEGRVRTAEQELSTARTNLSQAEAQARQILTDARQNAERLRQQILDQAQIDIVRVRENVDRDLQAEQQRVLAQVRIKIARDALARLQERLPGELNEQTQRQLLERSIRQLG